MRENKKELNSENATKAMLLRERQRYNIVMTLNSNCFFEYDMKKDIISFARNSMFSELSGIRISNCKEKIRRIGRVHPDDIELFLDFLSNGASDTMEFRYVKDNGSSIWCLVKSAIIRDEEGNSKTMIGSISDIDEQKRQNEMLMEQAMLDPLTKLLKRSKAQADIEEFLAENGNAGKHTLLLININHFEQINKRLGYVFGDGVLHNIADNLKNTFYKDDVIARIGGDDFLVFLKDTNSIEIVQEKVELLSELFQNTYIGEIKDMKISCSMGVARYPNDGRDFEELFKNADRAMYEARKNEGTSVVLYHSMQDEKNKGNGKYYHQYIIDTYVAKKQEEFSREIIDFAFDIMANTKDVESAIKLLLNKVGKHYHSDHIYIFEANKDNILKVSYAWSKEEGLNRSDFLHDIDLKQFKDFDSYYDKQGLCMIEDVCNHDKSELLLPLFNREMPKSLLQCAFHEEGIFKGCVSIDFLQKKHKWTNEEIDLLLTITKIISFYLLKLRVSEKVKEKMDYIRNVDTLTGLSTLHKFEEDVQSVLKQNPNTSYAVIYADFNKFKYINDRLGYSAGDRVLQEFSKMLTSNIWDMLLTCRVSADNFLMLTPYTEKEKIKKNIYQLSDCFAQKIKKETVSTGVYIVSGACILQDGDDVMLAIDNANLARKYIKSSSKPCCYFYDDKMEFKIKMEQDICNSMEQALENDEFLLYLQPKVNLKDNRIVGAEALTRWKRRDGTVMPPNDFIPLFEKNGFIINLDFYIYEKVCKMLREWLDRGLPIVPISVNVSRVHLDTGDFLERIKRLVSSYEIPHKFLEFELTESIFLDNTEDALRTMRELRELGFGVSIDDFGAGYSSLNLLKDMTTDVLKLDKEFFRQGDMKREEKIIVSSIINMAKQLSMKVLSEGVETQMQSDFLRNMSCDMAQGYLFARPMPVQDFRELFYENISLEEEKLEVKV